MTVKNETTAMPAVNPPGIMHIGDLFKDYKKKKVYTQYWYKLQKQLLGLSGVREVEVMKDLEEGKYLHMIYTLITHAHAMKGTDEKVNEVLDSFMKDLDEVVRVILTDPDISKEEFKELFYMLAGTLEGIKHSMDAGFILDGVVDDESVDEVAYTPGMVKAYNKLKLKLKCSKCGIIVPAYPGRYPKNCPNCAATFKPFREPAQGGSGGPQGHVRASKVTKMPRAEARVREVNIKAEIKKRENLYEAIKALDSSKPNVHKALKCYNTVMTRIIIEDERTNCGIMDEMIPGMLMEMAVLLSGKDVGTIIKRFQKVFTGDPEEINEREVKRYEFLKAIEGMDKEENGVVKTYRDPESNKIVAQEVLRPGKSPVYIMGEFTEEKKPVEEATVPVSWVSIDSKTYSDSKFLKWLDTHSEYAEYFDNAGLSMTKSRSGRRNLYALGPPATAVLADRFAKAASKAGFDVTSHHKKANLPESVEEAKKKKFTAQDYMNQKVNLGGEIMTVAQATKAMKKDGIPQKGIDYWLMGALHPRKKIRKEGPNDLADWIRDYLQEKGKKGTTLADLFVVGKRFKYSPSEIKKEIAVLKKGDFLKVSGKSVTWTLWVGEERGDGMGMGGPRQKDGGASVCKCPECGHTQPHEKGVPCKKTTCSKCDTSMIGEASFPTHVAGPGPRTTFGKLKVGDRFAWPDMDLVAEKVSATAYQLIKLATKEPGGNRSKARDDEEVVRVNSNTSFYNARSPNKYKESLEEASIDWKKAAKVLLKKKTDKTEVAFGYRAYLRAIISGQPSGHLLKIKGEKGKGAEEARSDLIDKAGKDESVDEASYSYKGRAGKAAQKWNATFLKAIGSEWARNSEDWIHDATFMRNQGKSPEEAAKEFKRYKKKESVAEGFADQNPKTRALLMKKFGKDPLYAKVIQAKSTDEMKKAIETLTKIRGPNSMKLMQKYIKSKMESIEGKVETRLNEDVVETGPDSRKKKQVFTQYAVKDNTFYPAGNPMERSKKLDPGIYAVKSTFAGPVYMVHEIKTDALLKFEDARLEEVLREVDGFWDKKAKFEEMGFTHKRGVLLYGDPGTGKSCLLKIAMEEMVARGDVVFTVDNPHIIVSALKTFRDIEKNRKVLVVIEDIDEMCKYNERNILQLFDGDDQVDNILFLATTNYIHRLPPRILRTGRFDRKIEVYDPPESGRLAYFQSKLGLKEKKDSIAKYAKDTDGFSFAQMREFLVGVYCLEQDPEDVIRRIRKGLEDGIEESISEEKLDTLLEEAGWAARPFVLNEIKISGTRTKSKSESPKGITDQDFRDHGFLNPKVLESGAHPGGWAYALVNKGRRWHVFTKYYSDKTAVMTTYWNKGAAEKSIKHYKESLDEIKISGARSKSKSPPANTILPIPHSKLEVAGAYLFYPSGAPPKKLKNLGWLLKNWKMVDSFVVERYTGKVPMVEAVLIAKIRGGRMYASTYASLNVLKTWLSRPVFKGLPISWKGVPKKPLESVEGLVQDRLGEIKISGTRSMSKEEFLFTVSTSGLVERTLRSSLEVPWVHTETSTLGGNENAAIMLKVSLDKEEDWANHILHNSRYVMFHIKRDGVVEEFSRGRGLPKFRKTRAKDVGTLVRKLNAYFFKVQAQGETRIIKKGGLDHAVMTSKEWGQTGDDQKKVEKGKKQVIIRIKGKDTFYPVIIRDSVEDLVQERQKASARYHQDEPGGKEKKVQPRQGSFKVGMADLNLVKKELGDYEKQLFKSQRDLINKLDRDLVAKIWAKDSITKSVGTIKPTDPDLIKAQEVIARRPRRSFQIWLRNVGKYVPKVGAALRKMGDSELVALWYYMMIMKVSGRDMANLILKKYLSTETDKWKAKFKKAKVKKECMDESGTGGGVEGADIDDFEVAPSTAPKETAPNRCKCPLCDLVIPRKEGKSCVEMRCPDCAVSMQWESSRTTAVDNMDKAAQKMATRVKRPGDEALKKKFKRHMLRMKKKSGKDKVKK